MCKETLFAMSSPPTKRSYRRPTGNFKVKKERHPADLLRDYAKKRNDLARTVHTMSEEEFKGRNQDIFEEYAATFAEYLHTLQSIEERKKHITKIEKSKNENHAFITSMIINLIFSPPLSDDFEPPSSPSEFYSRVS